MVRCGSSRVVFVLKSDGDNVSKIVVYCILSLDGFLSFWFFG